MTRDEAAELAVAELMHACPGVRPQDVRRVDYHPLTAGPAAHLDNLTTGRRLVTFDELAARRWLPACVEHRRPLRFAKLEGTYNGEKPCNARCMGASGPACECACAGANHGGLWG